MRNIIRLVEITEDTKIEDLLKQYPSRVRVFIAHGLPCLVCGNPFWGTIRELSDKHDVNLEKLLEKLNKEKQTIDEKK